jgi:hypothetical protein
MTKLEKWERALEEKRLWNNSLVEIHRLEYLHKRKVKLREKENYLNKAMDTWVYLRKGTPPKIELAWIIYSQLGWKGLDLDEEELWEDLPEIDPIEIMELCTEIDNHRTLNIEVPPTLIEEETLLSLRVVLNTLAEEGLDIRKYHFSQNWARRGKRHVGGRILEIAARTKQAWEIARDHEKSKTVLVKKSKEKMPKKVTKIKRNKNSILSSFFGIINK